MGKREIGVSRAKCSRGFPTISNFTQIGNLRLWVLTPVPDSFMAMDKQCVKAVQSYISVWCGRVGNWERYIHMHVNNGFFRIVDCLITTQYFLPDMVIPAKRDHQLNYSNC
jgi:hypothetical protein